MAICLNAASAIWYGIIYKNDPCLFSLNKVRAFMKKLLLIIGICSFCMAHAQKQGQPLIDSLLQELPKQKADSNKANLLNRLALTYDGINPDAMKKYADEALSLSDKLNYKRGIVKAYIIIGIAYDNQSNYPEALKNYFDALRLDQELGDKLGSASAYNNIGMVYSKQGNYPDALKNYFITLRIFEELGNKEAIASVYGNIGLVYSIQGNYSEAIKKHFAALKVNEELGDKDGIASTYSNIGNVYYEQGNYPEATKNYLTALKMWEELGIKGGIAQSYSSIGSVYTIQGNLPEALKKYYAALEIYKNLGDKDGISASYSNVGTICRMQGNYAEAIKNYFAALKINNELGNKDGNASVYNNIGIVCTITKKYKDAATYLKSGLALAKQTGNVIYIKESYAATASLDSAMGNWSSAYTNYRFYTQYSDSIFNKENTNKLVRGQMQYDFDKKEAATKAEQDKRDAVAAEEMQRQKLLRNGFMCGFSVVLIFAGIFFSQRNKIKQGKNKSDELLLNILPAEVAEELKAKGSITANHFDNVTVLFTDFVNFTKASENMSPQELVDELHNCFKAFDEITSKYNIEKIKTVGDAYLAVAGLPSADPDHAEHIVKAAIEINTYMKARSAELGTKTFGIRIGINSGSVIAGIVGIKKFSYDIWGDTVNTAARMEQNSEPFKINISQTTYELVMDKFPCEYRGQVEAKGKGVMKMYYLG